MEYEDDGGTNCNWRAWNGSPKAWKGGWKSRKSEDKSRPFKLQHY